ncbi:MAG TPA: hypothetical protein VFT59_01560 [Candidatus Saccharimonadales bacterium]|nr:hypothetical protein [Candidatus Saccharimonadales bacterium]
MNETIPLNNYGQPITYFGIAYTLTREDNNKLASVDVAIQRRLRDDIFFVPEASRHITIMNLTSVVDGYQDKDTVQFFEDHADYYRSELKAIANTFPAFKVKLNCLEASTHAIILRGNDHGQMENLRNELLGMPRLNGRLADPGFIHSTQARYKNQIGLDIVRQRLFDIKVDVSITIDKIGLVRADVGFSQPHTLLGSFKLQG